jgi:hypothetical protein
LQREARCDSDGEQRKTAKEQPAASLFFGSANRLRIRISAKNEISPADNFLDETAKTAKDASEGSSRGFFRWRG